MSLSLRPGSSYTFSQLFSTPITGIPAVSTRDFNGYLIPAGVPYVDAGNPNLFHVLVTIPSTAPISNQDSDVYTITFTGVNGTNTYNYTQSFNVVAYTENEVGEALAGLGVVSTYFSDSIVTYGQPDTTPTWNLISLTNATIFGSSYTTNLTIKSTPLYDGKYLQSLSVPLISTPVTIGEFISQWNWTVNGIPEYAFRQAFVISPHIAALMSQLKLFLDRNQVLKYDGYLLFQDVELVDCLQRACDRYNGTSPQMTYYTLDSLPTTLQYVILQIARYEALSRWYLSEGLLSFNFQGGSVSLDVDRTQYIQAMMNELQNYINTDVPRTKSTLAKTMSPGQLAINLGPNNNYIGNSTPNQLYSLRRVSLR